MRLLTMGVSGFFLVLQELGHQAPLCMGRHILEAIAQFHAMLEPIALAPVATRSNGSDVRAEPKRATAFRPQMGHNDRLSAAGAQHCRAHHYVSVWRYPCLSPRLFFALLPILSSSHVARQ